MKIKVEFELFIDGIEDVSDEEKFYVIEELLQSGAESNCADIKINSIEFKNE